MIQKTTSNYAYLFHPKTRSRSTIQYHLGCPNSDCINGTLDVFYQTIKNVVTSAAKYKTGGIYIGSKLACPIRAALEELSHP